MRVRTRRFTSRLVALLAVALQVASGSDITQAALVVCIADDHVAVELPHREAVADVRHDHDHPASVGTGVPTCGSAPSGCHDIGLFGTVVPIVSRLDAPLPPGSLNAWQPATPARPLRLRVPHVAPRALLTLRARRTDVLIV